jgi:hypothetical protein
MNGAPMTDDERLLRRAEKALTEIKVAQGLSDDHASVLAALRMRLTGDPGKSLEDMLEAAGDLGGPNLDQLLEDGPPSSKPKRSFDDVLSQEPKRKPSLDDLLGGG